MLAGFIELIRGDLDLVEEKINRELKLKSGNAAEYAHLEFNSLDKYMRPSLVLLCARLFNQSDEKTISLAGIVQLIHMASLVHLGIKDDSPNVINEEGIDLRDGSQFPVLVGDYLYGKFFSHLCDAKILHLLKPLSEIICSMNEGSILRKKCETNQISLKEKTLEIIRKETAELIAGACRLGASLTDADEEQLSIVNSFGMYLGMAYGIVERNLSFDKASEYLTKAHKELMQLKDNPARRTLEKLTHMLLAGEIDIKTRMVV